MENSFAKDEEILEEDHKRDDLLDFSKIINDFKSLFQQTDKNSLIGLVGEFGSGKSTMLYQLYRNEKEEEKWFTFDAWKYPDRQDLWEGFVLDFSKEVSPEEFKKVDKEIKGEQNDDKKTLIKVLSKIPGFAILEGVNHFFKTSPATRVDQVQRILHEQINKVDKELFIIIEDIDRSGDRGVFFLETLRNFIKNNNFKRKIVIIVPIGNKNLKKDADAYRKILDYIYFFELKNVNFVKFFQEVLFIDDLGAKQLNHLFKKIIIEKIKNEENVSIREIKAILRKANAEFKKLGPNEKRIIDPMIWIMFACIYMFRENVFVLIDGKKRFRETFWGKSFISMISFHTSEEKVIVTKLNFPFFTINNKDRMTPCFFDDLGYGKGYYLSDFYLNYFK